MARADAASASLRSDSIKGLAESIANPAYRRLLSAEPLLRRAVPVLIIAFMVTVCIGAAVEVLEHRRQAVFEAKQRIAAVADHFATLFERRSRDGRSHWPRTSDALAEALPDWAAGVRLAMTPGKGTMLVFNQRMTDTVINRCHRPDDGDDHRAVAVDYGAARAGALEGQVIRNVQVTQHRAVFIAGAGEQIDGKKPARGEHDPHVPSSEQEAIQGVWQDVQDIGRFVLGDRVVCLAMVQWTIGAILGLVVATLVPGFAARLLHVRAEDAVFIMAPAGVGMVVGTALLNRWGDRLEKHFLTNVGLFTVAVFPGGAKVACALRRRPSCAACASCATSTACC